MHSQGPVLWKLSGKLHLKAQFISGGLEEDRPGSRPELITVSLCSIRLTEFKSVFEHFALRSAGFFVETLFATFVTSDRTVPSNGWRRAPQVSELSAACASLWRQPIPSAMTHMRWPMNGNANGASECANSNVLVASDGTGGSRDTPKSLRKVAFGVATFALDGLSGSSGATQADGSWCRALVSHSGSRSCRRKDQHPIHD